MLAVSTSENQGHLSSRAAEYAQDKLEQLLALSYGDSTSDTRVFPAPELGGSGLTVGGGSNPANPVQLYVDYLDTEGALIPSPSGAPPAGWYYQRVWQITQSAREPEADHGHCHSPAVTRCLDAQTSCDRRRAQDITVLKGPHPIWNLLGGKR